MNKSLDLIKFKEMLMFIVYNKNVFNCNNYILTIFNRTMEKVLCHLVKEKIHFKLQNARYHLVL